MRTSRVVLYYIFRVARKLLQRLLGYRYSGSSRLLAWSENPGQISEKAAWYLPGATMTFDVSSTLLPDYDLVLLDDFKKLWTPAALRQWHKIRIVDPNFLELVEVSTWNSVFHLVGTVEEQDHVAQLSRENFETMQQRYAHFHRAVCFLSGPTIDRYVEFSYKDTLNVICNSIVKNSDLLNDAPPHVLAFADPVFHFSHNDYAAQFRRDMIACFETYGCYVIVPEFTVSLMLSHFPQLRRHIIGMPYGASMHFPSASMPFVMGTDNILTLFMLPVASSLCDSVDVIGADGRDPNETYFWKHNANVQYDDLMDAAKQAHPTFFSDQNYGDYYEKHCKILARMLRYGEARGKTYRTLTPSRIPALQSRYQGAPDEPETEITT